MKDSRTLFYLFVLPILSIIALLFVSTGNTIDRLQIEKQMLQEEAQKKTDSLITENNSLKEMIKDLQKENVYKAFCVDNRSYRVTVTGYHPVAEQCDDTPHITADGTFIDINRAGEYRYVALSRDLLKRWGGELHFGDLVYLRLGKVKKGVYYPHLYDGIYQVRDTMNSRYKKWVDVLLSPGETAFCYRDVLMSKVIAIDSYTFAQLFGMKK